jgi:choline-glycine betaine transporter
VSDENSNAHLVAKSGFFTGLHPGMGIAAKAMIATFVIFTVLNVEFAGSVYKSVRGWIESGLSWYYISVLAGVMLFCFFLMFSKFGNLRLGDDDSRPEFSNFSWFAMLFSAGIGIGILFSALPSRSFTSITQRSGAIQTTLMQNCRAILKWTCNAPLMQCALPISTGASMDGRFT